MTTPPPPPQQPKHICFFLQQNNNNSNSLLFLESQEKMGAASVKGLVLMESVFPSAEGYTVFDDPKIKQQLVKEMKKGTIKPPAATDEVDVDEDLDSKVDQMAKEIWQYYDPKGTGNINKKAAQKFLKDCFQLYSLRKRCKAPKDALAPGTKHTSLQRCPPPVSVNLCCLLKLCAQLQTSFYGWPLTIKHFIVRCEHGQGTGGRLQVD